MRTAPLLASLLAVLGVAPSVHADPEWNVGAQASVCGLGTDRVWQKTGFCGKFRGDLLLGRERNADFAWGPYATFGTATFSDVRFGGGLSLLLPTLEGDFPVVLSAGALSRNASDLRLAGEAFFGLRSHNFHGHYVMATGIVLGGDAVVSGSHGNTLYVGLQLDGLWLALPFILGYEWLHKTPDPGD
ncbi:MAG TPA: hypothetical protein VER04_18690 [Polyangiaceae bacterium]|jgi:hypothetical protein|nr:hypothetical protein [Polyangiaceae bacterium]